MPLTLAQKLAQLAIPLVATLALSSCASDGQGFGSPLPSSSSASGEVKRLPPYDPFGTGDDAEDAEDDADAPASSGLGARPQQATGEDEGENTVSKTEMAAVTPLESPGTPSSPIDGGASLSPFAGMSPEDLKAQWGAPSLMRTDAGAQLWQFKGKGCVVLAYLYPSASGGMETAYAEAHPGGDSASAVTGCIGKKARPAEAQVRPRKPELIVKPD